MKQYKIIAAAVIGMEILLIIVCNLICFMNESDVRDRNYVVEAKRIALELESNPIEQIDLDKYKSIVNVSEFKAGEDGKYDYVVEPAGEKLYRIEYIKLKNRSERLMMNLGFAAMIIISASVLIYVGKIIIKPFQRISDYSRELAKGNLTVPLKEEKNKFFEGFLWGLDMLRAELDAKKLRELELQKEKKTLVLSLSHDIKTPLSAIELYSRALQENLYNTEEKKREIVQGISKNVEEIHKYVMEITNASREDFLDLEVHLSEFYLMELINSIKEYYSEKLAAIHTEFFVDKVTDCLVKGDKDRTVEVVQNIMENAIKYGDGRQIKITFDEEEDCKLIQITNTGASLNVNELPNLFDSFYRGSNSSKISGSGLGLYIAKKLMKKMDGDVFAKISGSIFCMTVVIRKA